MVASRPIAERFEEKIIKTDGCWLWTGATCGSGNHKYGILGISKANKNIKAHRYSAMVAFGMFHNHLNVLHRCGQTLCVNPDHLYLGTQSDNTRDQVVDGTHNMARKTHCPRGHIYDESNMRRYGRNAGRQCRECDRERHR